jgi:hypothetical protein
VLRCREDAGYKNLPAAGGDERLHNRPHANCLKIDLGRAWLHRLLKNSESSGLWEGHDFSRAVKSLKIDLRFSARGELLRFGDFFRSLFSRAVRNVKNAGFSPLRSPLGNAR